MTKLPKEARSIAMIIRRGVERPSLSMFRPWNGYCWRTKKDNCCPMGMHPKATDASPTETSEFPTRNAVAMVYFWRWWDGQVGKQDLKEAIDAVWGKNK